MLYICLACILLLDFTVQGKLVNVTIDDQSASLFYSPAGSTSWKVGGASCQDCTAMVNASHAVYGTWHDSTHFADSGSYLNPVPNVSASFNGTAIYVICILAKTTSLPNGNSDMSFYIDDDLVGQFVKLAPGEPGFDYDVPVYSNTSVPAGQHRFTLQNGHVGGMTSLVLLDALVYTYAHHSCSSCLFMGFYSYDDGQFDRNNSDTSTDTVSSGSNIISTIVGFSLAGALALVVATLTAIIFRRQRRRYSSKSDERTAELVLGDSHRDDYNPEIGQFLSGNHTSTAASASSINSSNSPHMSVMQSDQDIDITTALHPEVDSPSELEWDAPPPYYSC
ncbi:uncharacterized protein EV420DRAFT_111051 [Desarmillaria tabescens]|uniref:Cellobiose dehydrogenase cytochrome domain-containing protein n=1 Tax=Armillaria tabescens TaxID=1929756 RepID=A0AA39NR83_ARMTA|nr:uncharacterized protein EV420DRAFT_111051 [Desarmillaria tabescens]KAK0470379.1 hypothetical protein EV420DRAFT_111051 [Desarmillaria tabescens]